MQIQTVPRLYPSILLSSSQVSVSAPPNQAFKRTAHKCRGSLKQCGWAAA